MQAVDKFDRYFGTDKVDKKIGRNNGGQQIPKDGLLPVDNPNKREPFSWHRFEKFIPAKDTFRW